MIQHTPRQRIGYIGRLLSTRYREEDLGNLTDAVEELVYISLTRQTHRQNAQRAWAEIADLGGAQALLTMPPRRLERLMAPSGFGRQKAAWVRRSLEMIVERMGELSLEATGTWSDDEVEGFLRSLPGIQIKTAKCIMLYSMARQVLPVDVHVRRVAERLGLVERGLSERAIHEALEGMTRPDLRYSLHVNLIWHGRLICTALRPRCEECILRKHCQQRLG